MVNLKNVARLNQFGKIIKKKVQINIGFILILLIIIMGKVDYFKTFMSFAFFFPTHRINRLKPIQPNKPKINVKKQK